jgi:hypothetical protein
LFVASQTSVRFTATTFWVAAARDSGCGSGATGAASANKSPSGMLVACRESGDSTGSIMSLLRKSDNNESKRAELSLWEVLSLCFILLSPQINAGSQIGVDVQGWESRIGCGLKGT